MPAQVKAEEKSANNGPNPKKYFNPKIWDRGPRGMFTNYKPLLTTSAKVYKEVMHTELTERPLVMRTQGRHKKRWCKYRRDHGHYTNECIQVKDAIERMGKLKEFVHR
jgi:hypothetical protein